LISSDSGGCFDAVFRNGGRFRASIRALISLRAVCSIIAGTTSAETGLRTASCAVLGACDFGVPPDFRRFIELLHVEDCVPTEVREPFQTTQRADHRSRSATQRMRHEVAHNGTGTTRNQ
jgi:hypothetical protein